tara:strand:+ start:81 stop:407 length:327 start_codon:yes stop_codon:yes gene_type:complete
MRLNPRMADLFDARTISSGTFLACMGHDGTQRDDSRSILAIPEEEAHSLTFDIFFRKYMSRNVPVVVKGGSKSWPASWLWVSEGRPAAATLAQHYGKAEVPVVNCGCV